MKAFTTRCKKINISIYNDAITIYLNSEQGPSPGGTLSLRRVLTDPTLESFEALSMQLQQNNGFVVYNNQVFAIDQKNKQCIPIERNKDNEETLDEIKQKLNKRSDTVMMDCRDIYTTGDMLELLKQTTGHSLWVAVDMGYATQAALQTAEKKLGIQHVKRGEDGHEDYHQDDFDDQQVHYHCKFQKAINESFLSQMAEILCNNELLSQLEKETLISEFRKANDLRDLPLQLRVSPIILQDALKEGIKKESPKGVQTNVIEQLKAHACTEKVIPGDKEQKKKVVNQGAVARDELGKLGLYFKDEKQLIIDSQALKIKETSEAIKAIITKTYNIFSPINPQIMVGQNQLACNLDFDKKLNDHFAMALLKALKSDNNVLEHLKQPLLPSVTQFFKPLPSIWEKKLAQLEKLGFSWTIINHSNSNNPHEVSVVFKAREATPADKINAILKATSQSFGCQIEKPANYEWKITIKSLPMAQQCLGCVYDKIEQDKALVNQLTAKSQSSFGSKM